MLGSKAASTIWTSEDCVNQIMRLSDRREDVLEWFNATAQKVRE